MVTLPCSLMLLKWEIGSTGLHSKEPGVHVYWAQPWSNATRDHRALCILLRKKIIIKSFGPNLTLETTAYRKGSDEYNLPRPGMKNPQHCKVLYEEALFQGPSPHCYYTILTDKVPISFTFNWKSYSFHIQNWPLLRLNGQNGSLLVICT